MAKHKRKSHKKCVGAHGKLKSGWKFGKGGRCMKARKSR